MTNESESQLRTILGDIGIWVGCVVGVLTIIDWLLTESQKQRVQLAFESWWLWLEERRSGRLIRFLTDERATSIIAAIAYSAGFLFLLWYSWFAYNELHWYITEYWDQAVKYGRNPQFFVFSRVVMIASNLIAVLVVPGFIHPRLAKLISKYTNRWTYLVALYLLYFGGAFATFKTISLLDFSDESYVALAISSSITSIVLTEWLILTAIFRHLCSLVRRDSSFDWLFLRSAIRTSSHFREFEGASVGN